MNKVVLVVDDSSTVRKFVSVSLSMQGFNVLTASDGMDALEKLPGSKVDLVITDLNMPNMDGFALIKALRENTEYKNLPVIILTSLADQASKDFSEKSKNSLPHRVPLSPLALELLQAAKNITGDSPWIFPSPQTDRHITPEAVDHALRRPGLEALGFKFVPHDLRRTAASLMTGMGISRLVVSKILNHVERGITAVYDRHSYDREKRQALESWALKLKAIVEGAESNVIPLIREG